MMFASTLAMVLVSCKKDDEDAAAQIPPDNRVFVVNEGPFMSGSGSLDVYFRTSKQIVTNAFFHVNGFELGNLVQSVNVHGDRIYIIVNNANKIEVAGKDDLVSKGRIEGINLPRYFLGIDSRKGYVSSWDNKVYILDLELMEISGSIPTATGPEKMMLTGDMAWVLNQGGFSYDSVVTVISTTTDEVIKNIVVGDKPSGIVQDANGMVWVMCSGNGWNGYPGEDDTEGRLVCIDPDALAVVKTFVFPDTENHPDKLVIDNNGRDAYFLYPGGLYSTDLLNEELEINLVKAYETMFYALGYDDQEGHIYVSDPKDYTQYGLVLIIDPETGQTLNSFTAGVIPGGFFFN